MTFGVRNVTANPDQWFQNTDPSPAPWVVDTGGTDVATSNGPTMLADSNDTSRIEWRDTAGRRASLRFPSPGARNTGEFLVNCYVRLRGQNPEATSSYISASALAKATGATDLTNVAQVGFYNLYGPSLGLAASGYVDPAFIVSRWVNPDNAADVQMLHERTMTSDFALTLEQFNGIINDTVAPHPFLSKIYFEYQFYTRPDAPTGLGPTGTVTNTVNPRITWTDTDITAGTRVFQVRVFSAAQYGAGGFDPETSTATWDSGKIVSHARECVVAQELTNSTTYRAYVRVGYLHENESGRPFKETDSVSPSNRRGTIQWHTFETTWTTYAQFTIDIAPSPAPTSVTPNGGTVTTDRPILGCRLPVGAWSTVRAQWQLATDAGFTTNVRLVAEPVTDLKSGEVNGNGVLTSEVVDAAGELFQGTWYVRARALDRLGLPGTWSSSVSFTVAHAPFTAGHSPTDGASRDFGGSGLTGVSWAFGDPSPYDLQTAYQIIVERNSDGLELYNSGKTVSTARSETISVSGTYKDVLLRWRVRVWDSDDVVGSYSANQQFYMRDAPTVTLVYPDPVELEINTPAPTVQWTFAASSGRTQLAYRVIFRSSDGLEILHDSLWQSGTDTSYVIPAPLFENGETYGLTLQVRDSVLLEGTEVVSVDAAWDPPQSPAFTVEATAYDTLGKVTLAWTNAELDGLFNEYLVYRRKQGDTLWTELYRTATNQANYTFEDYSAGANQTWQYAVVQSAERFGVPIESVYEPADTPLVGTIYWLISESQPSLSVPLPQVTADSFTDEYEEGEIPLIGRGRRVEVGTHFGYRGQLTANVWGSDLIARVEALKALREPLLLRNPFGGVWMVHASNVSVERIPGVGVNEYATLTIPYVEVS